MKENESRGERQERRRGWFHSVESHSWKSAWLFAVCALWPLMRGKSARLPAGTGSLMKEWDTLPLQELGLPHLHQTLGDQMLQLASLSKGGSVAYNVPVLSESLCVCVCEVFVYLVKELQLQEVKRGWFNYLDNPTVSAQLIFYHWSLHPLSSEPNREACLSGSSSLSLATSHYP